VGATGPGAGGPEAIRRRQAEASRRSSIWKTLRRSRTLQIQGLADSGLGEIYARTGKIQEAKDAYDAAAKINPTQAGFYYKNEAVIFFQTNQPDAQVAAADKAIAVDPTRRLLYYLKATAWWARRPWTTRRTSWLRLRDAWRPTRSICNWLRTARMRRKSRAFWPLQSDD
jgi:tetratricopeptide (TPR) repeat protein